jgi:predicted dehydrogenase
LKFLIAGFGSIGKRHLENILTSSNSEVIVYSKRKDLSSLERKNIKIFDSLERCISEKPDVGFITNETAYHIPVSKKLAQSGLDLFIEKPLSNSIKSVSELVKIVKMKKLITLMGCNLRFHDCIKKMKSLIEEEKIGKIISVQVECGTYLPDWHPNEDYSKGYSARDDLGGGVVLTCIHEIDYLYWFFGQVQEVFSITGKFSNLKLKSSDLSAIIMRFRNDIIAEVHLDYFQKPEVRSCKIIGTKGTIIWNSLDNEVKLYDLKKKKWITKLKIKNYKKNDMYKKELAYFLQCIRQKRKSLNDISQGEYVLKIALGIIKSSKLKKVVTIERK